MVDFNAKLELLRAWKLRRDKIGCECVSELPRICYNMRFADDLADPEKCKCECHNREG